MHLCAPSSSCLTCSTSEHKAAARCDTRASRASNGAAAPSILCMPGLWNTKGGNWAHDSSLPQHHLPGSHVGNVRTCARCHRGSGCAPPQSMQKKMCTLKWEICCKIPWGTGICACAFRRLPCTLPEREELARYEEVMAAADRQCNSNPRIMY